MKRYFLLLIAIICVVNCAKEPCCTTNDVTEENNVISIKEATSKLDSLLLELYGPDTKSSDRFIYDIKDIQVLSSSDIRPMTKSYSDNSRDLLYVVNFPDDKGFAILSATTLISEDVLCVTEQGSMSVEELLRVMTENHVTKSSEDSDDFVPIGLDIIPALLMDAVILETQYGIHPEPEDCDATKSAPAGTRYGPYLRTKWGQTTGYTPVGSVRLFNRYTPNHAAAGCVAIAAAQIMEWNKIPRGVNGVNTFDGYACSWHEMDTVYNYQIANRQYLNDTTKYEQVAHFVRAVGKKCDISYGSSDSAPSSGHAIDVKHALEDYGYSNVKRLLGFGNTNQGKATTCIRAQQPVYLDGYKTGAGGHAWVLDGECGNYYHINWGWYGKSDGYYAKGVFNTTSRYGRDDEYDLVTSTATHEYTWDFRLVTYNR